MQLPQQLGRPRAADLPLPAVALAGILALHLLLRLPGLLNIPLFFDEAVYLARAQAFPAMLAQRGEAGGTLVDGKLLQELALAALARLPGDPLLPARLLSLACGLATLPALTAAGRALGRPGAGLLAALLYALAPLAQLHDRLALPDSMLALVSALLLGASAHFARAPHAGRGSGAALGALLAAASLVKLSGLLLFCTPLLAVLLLAEGREERLRRLGLLRMTLIVCLACLAALAPFHYGGAERQKVGGEEPDRLALVGANLAAAGDWLLRYLPGPLLLPPLAALAIAGLAQARRRPGGPDGATARALLFLLGAGLALPLAFALVGRTVYPRYILPAWPALLLAAALGCAELWRRGRAARAVAAAALGAAALWGGLFGVALMRDPAGAPLAAIDRGQYLERWTAGHNLPALLADLRALAAREGRITLVHQDQPRLLNLGARIYLGDEPAIRRAALDLGDRGAEARLRALAAAGPTYLIADGQIAAAHRLDARFPNLRELRSYPYPAGPMAVRLFLVEP